MMMKHGSVHTPAVLAEQLCDNGPWKMQKQWMVLLALLPHNCTSTAITSRDATRQQKCLNPPPVAVRCVDVSPQRGVHPSVNLHLVLWFVASPRKRL